MTPSDNQLSAPPDFDFKDFLKQVGFSLVRDFRAEDVVWRPSSLRDGSWTELGADDPKGVPREALLRVDAAGIRLHFRTHSEEVIVSRDVRAVASLIWGMGWGP